MELTPSVFGSPAGSLATGFFAHASAFLSHSSANHRVCHISFSYPGKKSFDVQVAAFVTLTHFLFTSMTRLFPGRARSYSQSARFKIKKIPKLSFQNAHYHPKFL